MTGVPGGRPKLILAGFPFSKVRGPCSGVQKNLIPAVMASMSDLGAPVGAADASPYLAPQDVAVCSGLNSVFTTDECEASAEASEALDADTRLLE